MMKITFSYFLLLIPLFFFSNDNIFVECQNVTSNSTQINSTPNNSPRSNSTQNNSSNIEMFKNIRIMKNDCDKDATQGTLNWLIGKPGAKAPFLNETKQFQYLDVKSKKFAEKLANLSAERMNMELFRQYLIRKKYLKNPGTIHFLNFQDRKIKLTCGKGAATDSGYTWTRDNKTTSKNKDTVEDFDLTGFKNREFSDSAPAPYLYSFVYACVHKKCEHKFYVFTRPLGRVEQQQHHREGSNFDVTCEIYACLYNGNKYSENCAHPFSKPPKFHGTSAFYWAIHNKTNDHVCSNLNATSKCMRGLGIKITNGTHKENLTIQDEGRISYSNFTIRSNLEILEGNKYHEGAYECIVIDANGVPSTPSSLFSHNVHFKGIANVYIRKWYMVIIPIGVLALLLIITIAIIFICPPQLEDDNGNKYTKAEMNENLSHAKGLGDVNPNGGQKRPTVTEIDLSDGTGDKVISKKGKSKKKENSSLEDSDKKKKENSSSDDSDKKKVD